MANSENVHFKTAKKKQISVILLYEHCFEKMPKVKRISNGFLHGLNLQCWLPASTMYHEGKALRSRTGAAKTWDHGCLVCVCVFCSLTSWCLHPYRYLDKQKSSTSISWCFCDNFIWFSLDSISMNIFQCCQASASEAEAKEDGNSRDENAKASARSTVYFLYLKIFLSSLLFNKWKIGGRHQKRRCRVASGASTVKPSQHRVQRDSEIGWSCQRVRLSNEFGASIQTESWEYFPTTWFLLLRICLFQDAWIAKNLRKQA